METKELLKKVRKIEIKTRGLSSQLFSGEYHTAFKGKGMAFSEVREYMPGDEIRTIDWNVTARFNHPYVKVFEEEREMTVMLLIDVSASENFGTNTQTKREMMVEIAATLAFSAIQNNDKIGVILFSDEVELFIPPKKGKKHILRIIRELIEIKPKSTRTNIDNALQFFRNTIKKRSIVFVMSDFLSPEFEKSLKIVAKKHDTIGIRIFDERETELPNVGIVQLINPETGQLIGVNTSSKNARYDYAKQSKKYYDSLKNIFRKNGIDYVEVSTQQSYIKPLINLLKRR
ncbi:MAG: DUF58 domain-containing protein [Bacteroidia bacterium]